MSNIASSKLKARSKESQRYVEILTHIEALRNLVNDNGSEFLRLREVDKQDLGFFEISIRSHYYDFLDREKGVKQ